MQIPILHEQADEFHQRNLLLQLTLGLVALGDRLEDLLDDHAPPSAAAKRPGASPEEAALIDFTLGLLALHRALRAQLEAACPAAAPEAPAQSSRPASGSDSIRELLR
ncbi:MAG: hypothetical protein ACR2P8_10380 [Myxococcota bacterium]